MFKKCFKIYIIVVNIKTTCVLLRRSKVILERIRALTHVNRNLLFGVLTQCFLRMVIREIISFSCLQKTQSNTLKQKTIKTVIYDETLQLVILNFSSHSYIYLCTHMYMIRWAFSPHEIPLSPFTSVCFEARPHPVAQANP